MSLENFLNSAEFYCLMQAYRHQPPGKQDLRLVEAFEAVKAAILKAAEESK